MSEDATQASEASPFDSLTERERSVAQMLAVGAKNSEVADKLVISVKTVDTHRSHLLKKLRCRNNVELARLSARCGVTPL